MYRFEIMYLNWDQDQSLVKYLMGSATPEYNEKDYRFVYSRNIESADVDLDAIWAEFNVDHPEDHHDRSMSIGDVIIIYKGETVVAKYLVSAFGFDKI